MAGKVPITTLFELYAWLKDNNWPCEVILHPDDFWEITNRLQPSHRLVPIQIGATKLWPKAMAKALDVSAGRIFADRQT